MQSNLRLGNEMAGEFRFDSPPEVVAQREASLEVIRQLLTEDTLDATQRAIEIQRNWLRQYPDDYVMWDAGEVLAMPEDAMLVTEFLPVSCKIELAILAISEQE